jgi:hypothetical protein
VDLATPNLAPKTIEVFRILKVPREFAIERLQSVSHSFGSRTEADGGNIAWFHFLCKNIQLRNTDQGSAVVNHAAAQSTPHQVLSQEDHSWLRSGFFLRTGGSDGVACVTTLAVFGVTPCVRKRLDEFIDTKERSGDWGEVLAQPGILIDMIIEGLFLEVDNTLWKTQEVFRPLEGVSQIKTLGAEFHGIQPTTKYRLLLTRLPPAHPSSTRSLQEAIQGL